MATWVVSQDPQNSRDILYQEVPDTNKTPVPPEEISLREEIDKTLTVIGMLFPPGDARFALYFGQLLSLAQVGLGNPRDHALAKSALVQLKADVTATQAGRIKNRYMKQLGANSAILAAPAVIVAAVSLVYHLTRKDIATALIAWSGCIAGVWLSFGARKSTLTFEDLNILEQDLLEPIVRLVFAGLLTLIIFLSLDLGALSIKLGSLDTINIGDSGRIALFVGLLCGFSEQTLSTTVGKEAAQLIK